MSASDPKMEKPMNTRMPSRSAYALPFALAAHIVAFALVLS
ncbi:hypothetical protein [Novosphingobium sp. ST904]|nr:hypothetical protein [Novosphingobium sp. ST904]TCM41486.1 hypothetical protein EDF59_103238 [Novosphingobium sp. ST904]